LGLCLGLQGGLITNENLPNLPIYSLLALSILGLFDAYSGVFALLGFAIGQIVIGQVLDSRSIVVLLSLGLSLICVGLVSDLLYSGASKDTSRIKKLFHFNISMYVALVAVSLATGTLYYSTLLLTQSLSIELANKEREFLIPAIIIGFFAGLKILLHHVLDSNLTKRGTEKTFVMQEFRAWRFLSPMASMFLALSSLFIAFIWTMNWTFSLLFGLITFAIAATFTFKSSLPKIELLRKWRRNVFLESAIIAYLGYVLFILIRNLPYQASLKSQIFIISTITLPLVHALISSLHPEDHAEVEPSN
jgi:hypothetical protein